MKKFLTFLIFLFSVSFSQTYVCSGTKNGVELEKKTLITHASFFCVIIIPYYHYL